MNYASDMVLSNCGIIHNISLEKNQSEQVNKLDTKHDVPLSQIEDHLPTPVPGQFGCRCGP